MENEKLHGEYETEKVANLTSIFSVKKEAHYLSGSAPEIISKGAFRTVVRAGEVV